ncbi:MAG TPA: LysR family transcriptional regulator [Luteimonas sp.]|nr:LysR family transcriptional regulator [Luteimonas sp.]
MSTSRPAPPPAEPDPLASGFSTTYAGVIAFVAVADEGSFAKAGERLGIGRSAVSRSVRRLEDQLDARLFLRTTRSTALTREGERFYENCRPGIDRILQALEDMRDQRQGPPRGRLRISASPAFGRTVVMPLLGGFHAAYPGISIELALHRHRVDFVSDRIDVAFHDGRMEDSGIIARPLIPMQLVVCASPGYARGHGLPGDVDDIARHACIACRTEGGRIVEWEFKVEGQARRLVPESSYGFDDPGLALQAVLAGDGIAQLPGYLVAGPLRDGRLVACLAHLAPDDGSHSLCYQSRHHLPARVRVFVDYMVERIRALDRQYDGVVPPMHAEADAHAESARVVPLRRELPARAAAAVRTAQ